MRNVIDLTILGKEKILPPRLVKLIDQVQINIMRKLEETDIYCQKQLIVSSLVGSLTSIYKATTKVRTLPTLEFFEGC
jgi:hypothetical protein